LKKLETLNLMDSKVSSGAVKRLQRALPNLRISR
jgi:hypothetical protein